MHVLAQTTVVIQEGLLLDRTVLASDRLMCERGHCSTVRKESAWMKGATISQQFREQMSRMRISNFDL